MDTFLKCDLHMHSSSCFSRNYGEEKFLEALRNSKLDVISITDHNIIDIDLYTKIINDSTIKSKLIGGVELNVSLDPETITKYELVVNGDYFHSIIWFDINNINIALSSLKKLIGEIDEITVYKDSKELKKISAGMDKKSFTLKDIQEKFANIDYYFTFHENKGARNLSDYLPNYKKKIGEQIISNQKFKENLFYYNNSMSIEGGDKSKVIKKYFEKNLDTLVAAFLFSDAITLQEIGSKFTWINFDGEFSSLILPISDPTSRVFTSDSCSNNPQKNINNYLSGIKIKLKDLDGSEKDEELFFSPGLNGIIGARGDGKSMLGNIIAKENASTYKDYVDHENIEYIYPEGIKTRTKPKCKYLRQKDLFQIYENTEFDKLDLLKRYYEELLKENSKVVDEALTTIKLLFNDLKELILQFHKKYQGQTLLFTPLQKDVSPNKLLVNVDVDSMENSEDNLEKLKQFVTKIIQSWEKEKETLNNSTFVSSYPELLSVEEKKENFNKVVISSIDENLKIANEFLVEINLLLPVCEIRQKLIKLFHDSIDVINKSFDLTSTQYINEIDKLEAFFTDFLKARLQCYAIIKKIDAAYAGISTTNQSRKIKFEENEITVSAERECKLSFEDIFQSYIKTASNKPDILIQMLLESENFESVKEHIKQPKFNTINNFIDFINSLFLQVNGEVDKIQNAVLHLYFNGTDVKKLSPGRRSEILLRILLDPSILGNDYLFIILDQPDDDLDTKTINDLLVNKIKNMKLEMQFFIISHSAAVIINGDSDVIILAESETKDSKQKISYSVGKINTITMKEKIVTILDGGELNLKARLNKYDFNYKEKANV
jgi:hypothetical protein